VSLIIDLRQTPSGGFVATEAKLYDSQEPQSPPLSAAQIQAKFAGKDLVLATHGFNVSATRGLPALEKWDDLCKLPTPHVFVGVLWPGDSQFLPILDYPIEVPVAQQSGELLASFLNMHATSATSISMASHSLGARAILEAASQLRRRVATLALMASAIEDDCLAREYASAARNTDKIHVVASRADRVLQFAFPLGNPVGELLLHGHPYFRAALGRNGPVSYQEIASSCTHWQMPDGSPSWDFGHGDYMPGPSAGAPFTPPVQAPAEGDPLPRDTAHWKPAWSAAVIATGVQAASR
jgi:pimeloyl-ACP methyl ester carboxylesterase